MRRIPYLAGLRNQGLDELRRLVGVGGGFGKVLFLEDVVFKVENVLTLLSTNKGEYAAACSLDFSKTPAFYDTFALRDSEGYEHVTQTWPYFRSQESRKAMKMMEPVPEKSCWNGIGRLSGEFQRVDHCTDIIQSPCLPAHSSPIHHFSSVVFPTALPNFTLRDRNAVSYTPTTQFSDRKAFS